MVGKLHVFNKVYESWKHLL